MEAVRSYRDLKVWQRAMDLVVHSYELARFLPREELYGLTSQVRRAAVSVPANIAEGNGRDHRREYLYHLSLAHGSLMELETHLVLASRLGYVQAKEVSSVLATAGEVGRMLNGLRPS